MCEQNVEFLNFVLHKRALEINVYKVVARPTLLYGSETWVITKRDMTRLEAAEMRFLRSVKGYTRLDKIRSEVIITRDLWNTRRETQVQMKLDQPILKEWTTPDSRNTPSTTNLEEEEIVDAPGNDNASMPEQIKRTNPWRKMMMMIISRILTLYARNITYCV